MPGDQPSNGVVREAVTVTNGNICTQKHIYEHPFETVRSQPTACVTLRAP
jgi:hypothetical protein